MNALLESALDFVWPLVGCAAALVAALWWSLLATSKRDDGLSREEREAARLLGIDESTVEHGDFDDLMTSCESVTTHVDATLCPWCSRDVVLPEDRWTLRECPHCGHGVEAVIYARDSDVWRLVKRRRKRTNCDCEKYRVNVEKLDACVSSAGAHGVVLSDDYRPFRYCPWCGLVLRSEENLVEYETDEEKMSDEDWDALEASSRHPRGEGFEALLRRTARESEHPRWYGGACECQSCVAAANERKKTR